MSINEALRPNFWNGIFENEFEKPYYKDLVKFIELQHTSKLIFPKLPDVFKAFKLTDYDNTKVVLIGQDPYHGINQAHGLSFSVQDNVKIPPSLKNMFKELHTDLGISIPNSGNLTHWAKQGVLLLNATLTVNEGLPGSHQNKGWETFTDTIIKYLSDNKTHCVFLLWGNFAKTKANLIDGTKHLILEAAHPSPLARGAFFGCRHFSKTNAYLAANNKLPINWEIADFDLFS